MRLLRSIAVVTLAGTLAASTAAAAPPDQGFPAASVHEIADYCQAKAIASDARCTLSWCGSRFEKAYTVECRSYCLELSSEDALRCIPDAARSLRLRYLTPPSVDVAGYCRAIYGEVRTAWLAKGLPADEAGRRFDESVAACRSRVSARLGHAAPTGK